MWEFRRMTAVATLTALLFTAAGGAALATKGGSETGRTKVSERFGDMDEHKWGLGDVVRLMVKGVFKGRSESEFAPGAPITRQEMAVAAVRLMGREAEAKALTEAEVNALLEQIADQEQIATWARVSVALLVDLEAIDANDPFRPAAEATRLDVAVLLVKALGYTAEAEAKMAAELTFKDAGEIPADLAGYVAAAVDHGLIKGYDNGAFLPDRAVKRVEMAVMMGRADRQIDRHQEDEVKGSVTAVSAAQNSLTLLVGEESRTFTLAAEAAVFVDHAEADLADITADMKAELKLNADGEAVFVEAEAREEADRVKREFRGAITGLIAADGEALAVVEIDGEAYSLSQQALIRLKGTAITFADLALEDRVEVQLVAGLITRINVEGERSSNGSAEDSSQSPAKTVEGKITLILELQVGPLGVAKLMVSSESEGELHHDRFLLLSTTEIRLNGEAAAWADLETGDAVILTIVEGKVQKVEASR